MAITARETKVGKLYESYYPNKTNPETIYRFLRIEGDEVVWLEGKGQPLGRTGRVGDIGLYWEECLFKDLSKELQTYIMAHPEHGRLLTNSICVCDSKDLFYSGCQCGHLKLLREAKRART